MLKRLGLALCLLAAPAQAEPENLIVKVNQIFRDWQLDSHVPGVMYGVVVGNELSASGNLGIQDTGEKRPVTRDSQFRIASMSKAFTALAILKLRDEGKLSLDALAETYVPEMRGWRYPTTDSRRIRVRDLLNHSAGLVTDDPWGDRQQPMSEAEFSRVLNAGVPFSRQPGQEHEYSNFGYATLGRIITNVSGKRYQDYIRDTIFKPLGMTSTTYDIGATPLSRRAIGYRWQDGGWVREPDMADGVFGAMGGVETNARDYARWVSFLLSAWPPRDGPDTGPVKRSTVREIVEGSNFVQALPRAAGGPCRVARAYGMGWRILDDCDLGRIITHSGGYPGYGSNVLLLPDKGIGIFAFANRTYAGATLPVLKAALAMKEAGYPGLPSRETPVSATLAAGYDAAREVWSAGTIEAAGDRLAMNMLLDRDVPHWRAMLAGLKAEVGACRTAPAITPSTAMQGRFTWLCEHGRIAGTVLMAPTPTPSIQTLDFQIAQP